MKSKTIASNTRLTLGISGLIAIGLVLVSLMFIPSKAAALSGAEFNAANIIDDSVFFDKSTMSPNQIQAFLNARVPACDTWHAKSSSPNDPGPPYKCLRDYTQAVPNVAANSYCSGIGGNGTVYSAAQIISIVSDRCGINPQALIVLLQKEQSLITDTWPWPIQYRSATGYGCPDTAPCDAEYYGYFNQVYNAAKQFKRYVQTPENYNYAAGRNSYIAYNPNGGCGGRNVTIQNGATAALYNYTPYQPNQAALNNLYGTGDGCSAYGNRNFWRMFNDWFGSTNGDLVRTPNDPKIYLLSGENKYPINNQRVLSDFSRLGPIRYVTDQVMSSYTTQPSLSNMVQKNGGALYLVNASIKMGLSSCSGDVAAYGYTCANGQYSPLTDSQIQKLSNGPSATRLVKPKGSNSIYYMENGKKRPVASWMDVERINGNSPVKMNVLTPDFVNKYSNGSLAFGPGRLVKTSTSASVYVVRDLNYVYPISSLVNTNELGLSGSVGVMSSTDLQTYTISPSILRNKLNCGSSNYLGTLGKNYSVSDPTMTTYGYNSGEFLAGGGLCSVINISSTPLGRYLRAGNSIYYINNSGQKQAFGSYSAYSTHQAGNGNPGYISVSTYFVSTIPSGSVIN
ncbi:hypothetical protein HZB74_03960 [Candidatus Saccharibacteria bacterium]|nr:hypothetical protein [Candidatus Saccharibacteria bacterium]